MTTKEAIQAVLKFKSLVINLINGHGDRTAINQNISIIKRILYITGTHKSATIAPPPAVGGLMLKNVDPLDIIFNVPYGMELELYTSIVDSMDETIGVLKANPEIIERYEEKIKEKKHQNDKKDSLKVDKTKVFIVHGRDNELKESVARFIEKLGLEAIVLHEQPNAGKTIIEKFENAADVGFASDGYGDKACPDPVHETLYASPDPRGYPPRRPCPAAGCMRSHVLYWGNY